MAAAMQLSAVTSYLTANVAAIPLLWILPLAVYLLTLILAFQFPRLLPRAILTRLLLVMLASLGYMLSHVDVSWPMRIAIIFFLLEILRLLPLLPHRSLRPPPGPALGIHALLPSLRRRWRAGILPHRHRCLRSCSHSTTTSRLPFWSPRSSPWWSLGATAGASVCCGRWPA